MRRHPVSTRKPKATLETILSPDNLEESVIALQVLARTLVASVAANLLSRMMPDAAPLPAVMFTISMVLIIASATLLVTHSLMVLGRFVKASVSDARARDSAPVVPLDDRL